LVVAGKSFGEKGYLESILGIVCVGESFLWIFRNKARISGHKRYRFRTMSAAFSGDGRFQTELPFDLAVVASTSSSIGAPT
jgi:hypothetical protein